MHGKGKACEVCQDNIGAERSIYMPLRREMGGDDNNVSALTAEDRMVDVHRFEEQGFYRYSTRQLTIERPEHKRLVRRRQTLTTNRGRHCAATTNSSSQTLPRTSCISFLNAPLLSAFSHHLQRCVGTSRTSTRRFLEIDNAPANLRIHGSSSVSPTNALLMLHS